MGRPSGWLVVDRMASIALIIAAGVVIWSVVGRQVPRRPAADKPPNAVEDVALVTAPVGEMGSSAAPIVLVEFADFQCPFCARFARETYASIHRDFIEQGSVAYFTRHLPLNALHPLAYAAAEAAECARDQDAYPAMRTALFDNPTRLSPTDLLNHARGFGLSIARFERCLREDASSRVDADLAEATRLGVTATPTFFAGIRKSDGALSLVKRINGAQKYEVFRQTLQQLVETTAKAKQAGN
jgi:protein-disulfide isomerase